MQIKEVRISPGLFLCTLTHRCSDAVVIAGHRRRTDPQSLQGGKEKTKKRVRTGPNVSPELLKYCLLASFTSSASTCVSISSKVEVPGVGNH